MADLFLPEHCETIVSGEVWPEGFTELIQTLSIGEFFRNAGLPGNLNIVDHNGRTLLCHAVLAGHPNRLRALLTMGADPNSTHVSGGCMQPSDERGYCHSLHDKDVSQNHFEELFELLRPHGSGQPDPHAVQILK